MATPNLVNVTSITPFTIAGAVKTSNDDIINVAADKVKKINSIIVSNVDGTNSETVSISVSVDNGSNYYHYSKNCKSTSRCNINSNRQKFTDISR